MDLGIKGKWALVGGASKGLGLGCAQALAAEGVNVVMVARGGDALHAAADAIRVACHGVQVLSVTADNIWVVYALGPWPGNWWITGGWIVLALLGAIVQTMTTGKTGKKKRRT